MNKKAFCYIFAIDLENLFFPFTCGKYTGVISRKQNTEQKKKNHAFTVTNYFLSSDVVFLVYLPK